MNDFEVPEAFKEVARLLHTQSDDAARRNAEIAAEAAETQAWDAYALAFVGTNGASVNRDPQAAADFADALLARRRKAFGVELLGSPVKCETCGGEGVHSHQCPEYKP